MQKSLHEIRVSHCDELSIPTYLLIAQDLLNIAVKMLQCNATQLTTLSFHSIKVNYINTPAEYISIEIDNQKSSHKKEIIISAQEYVHQIFSILNTLLSSTNKQNYQDDDQRCAEFVTEHFDLYFQGKNNHPLEALEKLSTLIRIINDDSKNTPFQIEEADDACITPCNTEETESSTVISALIEHEEIFSPRGKNPNMLDIFSPRTKIAPLETLDLPRDAATTNSIKEQSQQRSLSSYFFGTPKDFEKTCAKIAALN